MKSTFIDSPGKASLIEWLSSDYPNGNKWTVVSPDGDKITLRHDVNRTSLWVDYKKHALPYDLVWRDFKQLVKEIALKTIKKIRDRVNWKRVRSKDWWTRSK